MELKVETDIELRLGMSFTRKLHIFIQEISATTYILLKTGCVLYKYCIQNRLCCNIIFF